MTLHSKEKAHVTLQATRREYVLRGRRALLRALLAHSTATADDMRAAVTLPAGVNPKLFGSVPGALAKKGIIVADGYRPSTRPEAHGRPIQVWRLADREGALRWLLEHPEPPVEHSCPSERQGHLFDFGARDATREGW